MWMSGITFSAVFLFYFYRNSIIERLGPLGLKLCFFGTFAMNVKAGVDEGKGSSVITVGG